ncbi:MAG: protein kinase [Nitrososphaeraceae archaeon]|jgi:superkiller protein 3|nr:protein kinase [Nitrososphaeraceae archaeon]
MNKKKMNVFLLICLIITIGCFLFGNQILNIHGINENANKEEKTKKLELLKLAKKYLKYSNYDKALAALDVALTISPDDSNVLYLKGNILEKQGKSAEANSTYHKAIAQYYLNSTIHFALAKLLSKMENGYDASLKSMDQALHYDPANSTLYYEKGKVFLVVKNYHDAIKEFNKAAIIENKTIYHLAKAGSLFNLTQYAEAMNAYRNITTFIDAKNIDAYLGTAKSQFELKKYDDALNAYGNAIKLGENSSKLLVPQAQKLIQLNQFETAKKYLNHTMSIYPNDTDAYRLLGDALYHLKNYTDALNAYRNSTVFDPKNIDAYRGTANSLFELKKYDEALNTYDKTIKLGNVSNPSSILVPQAQKLIQLNQFETAKKYLNHTILLLKNYKDKPYRQVYLQTYLFLGDTLFFHLKNYTDALNAYHDITIFDINNIRAYIGIAKSQFELKKYDEALNTYDKVYDLGFDPLKIYTILNLQADKLYKLNNTEMTVKYADKSISFYSLDSNAYFIKGKALFKQKEFKDSRKSYNEALSFDPQNSTIFFYKGNAYAEDKIYKKALSEYNKALANNPSTQERNEINNAIKKIKRFL